MNKKSQIDPFLSDRDILSVCQRDLLGAARIGSLCQVSVREKIGSVDQRSQSCEGAV